MRKLRIVLILGFIWVISSCATSYNNKRLTSDDCLVLIPVGIDRPSGTDLARTYTIHVSGLDHTIRLPKTRRGYAVVKIRNESQDIIAIKSKVTNSNYTGRSSKDEIFRDLPYSPGKVMVCDFRIIQKVRKVDSHRFTSSIDFESITEGEKEDLVKNLLSQQSNSSWVD